MSSFAERLKSLMLQKNISAAKIAKSLNLKVQAVYKWQNGGEITIQNAKLLASVLKVETAFLLFGVEAEKNEPVSAEEMVQLWQELEPKYQMAIYKIAKGLKKD
jgi:transcriptional regulator with XRE-family HTH domain